MISKKDIAAFASSVRKKKRGLPDTSLMHPERDWALGLLFALAVAVAGGAYAAHFFFVQTHNADDEVIVDPLVPHYDAEEVDGVRDAYRRRAATFDALRSEEPAATTTPPVQTVEEDEDAAIPAGPLNAE